MTWTAHYFKIEKKFSLLGFVTHRYIGTSLIRVFLFYGFSFWSSRGVSRRHPEAKSVFMSLISMQNGLIYSHSHPSKVIGTYTCFDSSWTISLRFFWYMAWLIQLAWLIKVMCVQLTWFIQSSCFASII